MSLALRQTSRAVLRTSYRSAFLIRSIRGNATAPAAAAETAEAAPAPVTPPPASPVDPKIATIVESISKLTLTETSALIKELKVKLDIPDMAFPAAGAVAAAPAADEAPVAEKEKPKEKTIFNLKLDSFDAKSKAKVIKEVKSELGLSLVAAKKLVESAPKVLKENMSKEDAEKFKAALEKHGAKVTLE